VFFSATSLDNGTKVQKIIRSPLSSSFEHLDPSAKEFLVDAGVVLENLGPAPTISASLPNLNSFLSEGRFMSKFTDSLPLDNNNRFTYKFTSFVDPMSATPGRSTPVPSEDLKSMLTPKVPYTELKSESLIVKVEKLNDAVSSQIPSFAANRSQISKLASPRDFSKKLSTFGADPDQSKILESDIPAPSSLNRYSKYGRFIRSQHLTSSQSGDPSTSLVDLSRKDLPESQSKLPGLVYSKAINGSSSIKNDVKNLTSPTKVSLAADQTKISKLSPKQRPKSEHITYQVSKLAVPKKSIVAVQTLIEVPVNKQNKPLPENPMVNKPYPALPKRKSLLKPPTDVPTRLDFKPFIYSKETSWALWG